MIKKVSVLNNVLYGDLTRQPSLTMDNRLLSCGVSNYSGAVFHITCHGFFKALLFLATGCLVGRCLLEQNYYILGGLNKVLPLP